MDGPAWLLLALFLTVAAVDWYATARKSKRLEYLAKPGCMVFLIAAALVLEPADDGVRVALVAALVLSALGDVFLMLPGRQPDTPGAGEGAPAEQSPNLFIAGLGSFLLAHLAYVVGFAIEGQEVFIGFVPVALLIALVGRPVVDAVRGSSEPELAIPVMAYIAVISAMVLLAFGTGDARAAIGATLFAASDSLIAWERFVKQRPWAPMTIIVTYHLAQALLVLSFT